MCHGKYKQGQWPNRELNINSAHLVDIVLDIEDVFDIEFKKQRYGKPSQSERRHFIDQTEGFPKKTS